MIKLQTFFIQLQSVNEIYFNAGKLIKLMYFIPALPAGLRKYIK